MPSYSKTSLKRLSTCDERLQILFHEVIKYYDCSILCGHRGQEEQDEAYRKGYSKLKFPRSKHNALPSKAVDVAPYPIDWNDHTRFYHFAGFVKGIAAKLGLKIRCGCDWDGDNNFKDQTFHDLPHFELLE
jgi:peptidoglycan L-alanyl-D-glutamate endopeptidase CwlK